MFTKQLVLLGCCYFSYYNMCYASSQIFSAHLQKYLMDFSFRNLCLNWYLRGIISINVNIALNW